MATSSEEPVTGNEVRHRFPLVFVLSAMVLAFGYGVVVVKYRVFPYQFLQLAEKGYRELTVKSGQSLPQFFKRVECRPADTRATADQACPGLNLITEINARHAMCIKITDLNGRTLHSWQPDWFTVWPDATHVPQSRMPRSRPGTQIHGVVLLENGDVVFNFEFLGLVRMDSQGKTVWRLPYRTHHSIHRHTDGRLWVCGLRERSPSHAGLRQGEKEDTILEVTPEGKILREYSVEDILRNNGWSGLLRLYTFRPDGQTIRTDTHLNDVEPFPDTLPEGFFRKGDILVSLRNVNTVFAFEKETEKIKFMCTGRFIWQHDPDFIDGNTFSVFDNNTAVPGHPSQSRILIVTAPEQTCRVFFEGTPENPFYAPIMGKNQWLPNGNLLLVEATRGRGFEINPRGEVVWEYINSVGQGLVGFVEEVQRLPGEYARLFPGLGNR
jgi:hypothetical protein